MWRTKTLCTLADEDLGTIAEYDPLTGYEPELNIQESSGENRSLNSHGIEYDGYTIGIALPSPLFTQEREEQRAVDTLTTLLTKVCRPVSRRLSVIEQGDLLKLSLIH